MVHDEPEPPDFVAQDVPAARGQRVIPPLRRLAVRRGLERLLLLDQPSILQPLNRLVERAGAKADGPVGAFFDVLFDGVSVPGAVCQRQEDVDDGEGERFHNVSLDDTSREKFTAVR